MPKFISVELRNFIFITGAAFFLLAAGIVGSIFLDNSYRFSHLYPSLTKDAGILAVTTAFIGFLALTAIAILFLWSIISKKRLSNMVKCQLFGICCVIALSTLISLALFWRGYAIAENKVKDYLSENFEPSASWNKFQQEMKCCGIEGYEDWGDNVPNSCCPYNRACTKYFRKGCYKEVEGQYKVCAILLISFMALALLFQVACLINIISSMVGDLRRRSSASSGRR